MCGLHCVLLNVFIHKEVKLLNCAKSHKERLQFKLPQISARNGDIKHLPNAIGLKL